MSRVDAAAASDRLPWLSDEPQTKPAKRSGGRALLGWAAAALAVVAGAGFWLGTRSVEEQPALSARQSGPALTVPLPEPQPSQPEVGLPAQPEVLTTPAPEVRPAPTPQVRIAPPPQRATEHEEAKMAQPTEQEAQQAAATVEQATTAPKPITAAPRPQAVPLRPWQPRVVSGAAGRLVEIGAFGSVPQAKLGWRYMVRTYPAMTRLPAVVRLDRNSKGRTFYRFRVGTTSQAHSEILCQRMQRIGLSCAVVGLPWKTKVER
jgi:outer membrane biosynthesis protein TonB